ncbi:MAG: hypothetical protein ACYTG1_03780 [Planctomycetota bacterium]|jgi:hypothetical protein
MKHDRTNPLRAAALIPCVASLLFMPPGAAGQTGSELFLVDFEGFAEETEIDDEYAVLGIAFSIDGNPAVLPIIAIEGSPTIGFVGAGDDAPMSDGIAGLTDPLVGGDFMVGGQDIVMTFDPPVTSVRFFVVDIDSGETYTARAYDGSTEVNSDAHAAGQPGTGNAVSTEFFLSAASITSVVLEIPILSGFAIDFLSFTRPCSGAACGPLVEISQESAPGVGDFDTNILGTLLTHPTTASAAGFYAYDVPEGDSWNGQALTPVVDRSHLLLADTSDGLSLFITHDCAIPDDPDGGQAEMRFELSGDPDGMFRSVEDDPPPIEIGAAYTGDPGDSVFTAGWEWAPCCTDGQALSGLDGDWSMLVVFTEVDGNSSTLPIARLTEWVAYSSDGIQIPLALEVDRRVRLRSLGVACPEDCAQPPDGQVDVTDLLAVLAQWGQAGTPCDTDGGGAVDVGDLLAVLGEWGPCGP